MIEDKQSLEDLQLIKQMMERSSRFISLSGLSGISASVCALLGAWFSFDFVRGRQDYIIDQQWKLSHPAVSDFGFLFNNWLFWIAMATFVAAVVSAFIFTWIKSKKQGTALWGYTAQRLLINVSIPLIAGAIYLFHLIRFGTFGLIAPGCLIFYGLALVNASKYTLNELRYLGYCQLLLGILNLQYTGAGIYFWAVGFGLLHIIYGAYMWWKYERN